MRKLGLDVGDFVQLVNNGIAVGRETNQSELNPYDIPALNTTVVQVATHAAFQGGAAIIEAIFEVRICASVLRYRPDTDSSQNFDDPQDTNGALGSLIEYLSNATINRTDIPFDEIYNDVVGFAYASNALPTLWFFGSGVSAVVTFKTVDPLLIA